MKKHEMIEQIQNNNLGSSIYSKEDVIRLIEQIEAEPAESTDLSLEQLDKVAKGIMSMLEELDADQLVDFDSIQLSINYHNTIEVDGIDTQVNVSLTDIKSCIADALAENEDC